MMFVKLPIVLITLRNWSGRCQATVKAQIAPELAPEIARSGRRDVVPSSAPASIRRRSAWNTGRRARCILRGGWWCRRPSRRPRLLLVGRWPGLMKTPIVTGISRAIDQVVEDIGDPVVALGADKGVSVEEDHQAGRPGGVILRRDVDPIVAGGVRINFARQHVDRGPCLAAPPHAARNRGQDVAPPGGRGGGAG